MGSGKGEDHEGLVVETSCAVEAGDLTVGVEADDPEEDQEPTVLTDESLGRHTGSRRDGVGGT
jgi:hypothetical protein